MRHQDLEADGAVSDALLGHLDCGDVASVAENRCCPVANLAHDRDRDIASDIRRVSRCKLIAAEAAKSVELDATQRQPYRLIFGSVEGAGRALDPAFDL